MARFEYVKSRREDVRKIPVRYEKLVRLGAKLYMKLNASLWPVIVEAYPPYDEYQARTDRDMPVFVCDPVD